ncbi:MAG: cyclic-di-AMP receptor [Anaerolineae bacterium]|nr:cyclic-di-AMP receptor [Anaerolineae bacterium]MBL6965344.1 cyclic-di-AMP receptor [Anaerolineales bacterium]
MKMIISILKDDDTDAVSDALVDQGHHVTRIASSGGFLRQGRSTLMIGVPAEEVDQAIQIVNENCVPTIEPMMRKATVFVLNVEYFEQI